MNKEPTPRVQIADLYRLEKERLQAHERVIKAIRNDSDITPHEQKRESVKQEIAEIRNHLKGA